MATIKAAVAVKPFPNRVRAQAFSSDRALGIRGILWERDFWRSQFTARACI